LLVHPEKQIDHILPDSAECVRVRNRMMVDRDRIEVPGAARKFRIEDLPSYRQNKRLSLGAVVVFQSGYALLQKFLDRETNLPPDLKIVVRKPLRRLNDPAALLATGRGEIKFAEHCERFLHVDVAQLLDYLHPGIGHAFGIVPRQVAEWRFNLFGRRFPCFFDRVYRGADDPRSYGRFSCAAEART